jgi:hypothetical protein
MCFASWDKFREEFKAAFCPENKATTALMRLELDCYFQGKWNVEAYIDKFKDLIDLSGYTDPIAIVLKFHHGLNPTTQNRIAESGMDRPQDRDFDGWFKAARRLDLNCLANKAFHYASRHPLTQSAPTLMTHSAPPHTPLSFLRSQAPPTVATPVAMHTPSRALPPGVPMDVDCTRSFKPITQTCHHCGQTSHFSKECDLQHDVRHMMLEEEDKFIQHVLANRDAAMAAAAGDNLNTTQAPEYTKDKYNVKIIKRKSLQRSHQQPM